MNIELSAKDIEEVFAWIDKFNISRPKRNINRDFSDAGVFLPERDLIDIIVNKFVVPLVEMLKLQFPKAVDVHNYSASNSFAQKLDNWRTLQRKVFTKLLNINFPENILIGVSKGQPGVIEQVLWHIKMAIDKIDEENSAKKEDVYMIQGIENELEGTLDGVVPIKIKQGSKILDQRIIPASLYHDMVEEIKSKNETIRKLTEKVEHLEKMIELKDGRIEDLRTRAIGDCKFSGKTSFLGNFL